MTHPPADKQNAKRLLVLRTATAAQRTAEKAESLGWTTTASTLWRVAPLAQTADGREKQAKHLMKLLQSHGHAPVLLTSSNIVDAFNELVGASPDLAQALIARTAFVVGATTAEAVACFNFRQIHQATGDGASLARLVAQKWTGAEKTALHLCGLVRADEPARSLEAQGWQVVPVALYEMCPQPRLDPPARTFLQEAVQEALCGAGQSHILFTSAQAVRVFAELLQQEGADFAPLLARPPESGQKPPMAGMIALVPSESVARTVREVLAVGSVRVSDELP